MSEFDPSLYTRAPVISVSGGITLARGLVAAKPEGLSRGVDRAAKKLEQVADAAQDVLALRQRAATEGEENTRVVDGDADTSWSAMRMRLEALAVLPDSFATALRARRVLQSLFGDDGLTFLRERYPVQYALADTILKRIDADGLQAELDSLAGPEFMANIRAQHERYRAMVQGIMMRERATEENLHDHMRALQRAITSYAIQVCATVEEDDAVAAERARVALLPLANHRQQPARGRGNGTTGSGDDEPAAAEATEAAGAATDATSTAAGEPPPAPGSNEPT